MMSELKNAPVAVFPCESYDPEEIYGILRRSFEEVGLDETVIRGKKVLLKPNLVMAKKPEYAATTHPAVIEACARRLSELGAASITLADSPGGPYAAPALSVVYKTCGMTSLNGVHGIALNNDFTFRPVHLTEDGGGVLKYFNLINAVAEAEVLINLCKLKTHSLTGVSAAVKNVFGVIPGVEKFEMHATFPTVDSFSAMLVELNQYLLREKAYFSVCDGIVGMEGNGPSHGIPKKAGLLLVSPSPFALDVAAEHILGFDGQIRTLDLSAERGLCHREVAKLNLTGLTAEELPVPGFKKPDNASLGLGSKILKTLPDFMGGRLVSLFEARPEIDRTKCVGCGVCVRSCPRHTITVEDKKEKKLAVIHREDCIKCYCCQELCPIGAVKTKKNPLIRLIH